MSLTIGWVAVIWVGLITILFSLPVIYPVDSTTFNYTPAAMGGVFVLIIASWFLYAQRWFKGPQSNLDTAIQDDENPKLAYA